MKNGAASPVSTISRAAAVRAAVALGSNIGDRAAHLAAGIAGLRELAADGALRVSTIIETAPVGPVAQGPFLNAAAVFSTTLAPRTLLERLHQIERAQGRRRGPDLRWGPRTLDLDLLLYGGQCIAEPGLTVPHPRLRERLFVLTPLAEIAPEWPVPPDGRRVADLLNDLAQRPAEPEQPVPV